MYLLVYVLCVSGIVWGQTVQPPTVNIAQGTVQGARATDGEYDVFYGIPYAGRPTEENRFKPPTPAPNFPGTFIASDSSVTCAQPGPNGLRGTEDCLMLNVYSRSVGATNPNAPVMVWLHGGHYATGTNQGRSFKNLVDNGVVVVALNYRLSVFGFLCLGVPEASGNMGLKDVIAGLQWVRDNIGAFGGNSANVLLFGQGSGAAMVDLVTLSPLSNNLVHKAIAQSGSALSPWAVAYNPIERAREFGAKLGYTGLNDRELATRLSSTELSLLANALNDFDLTDNSAVFAPCIENSNLPANQTFMTVAPINILRTGNYSRIPVIYGYTDREGTLRAPEVNERNWLTQMQGNFAAFLQPDLAFSDEATRNQTAQSIRQQYFRSSIINMETIEDYLDYHGDTMILVSAIRTARERAAMSRDMVRLYEFGYIGSYGSDWIYQTIPLTGARHGHELNYLFSIIDQPNAVADSAVARSLARRWTGFALNGIPIAPSYPGNVPWPAISESSMFCLEYSQPAGTSGVIENSKVNPHQQRMTFWNDIYQRFYQAPRTTNAASGVLSFAVVVGLCQLLVRFLY